jgi:hypothetical protein
MPSSKAWVWENQNLTMKEDGRQRPESEIKTFVSNDIFGTALDLTNNGSDTGQDISHTHSFMPA